MKNGKLINQNSKQLVIGAYNYKNPVLRNPRGGIKLFIDTLRKYNSNCCVIVICHIKNYNLNLKEYLNRKNVNILYNNFKELHFDDRFLIIKEILLKYKHSKILISDIQDVMFQCDPFGIKDNNKLYCSCESSFISDDNFCGKINRKWIKEYYPHKTIWELFYKKSTVFHKKKIICCGTILGNYKSIIQYLQWYSKSNLGNKRIVGQGLYNIYCYHNTDKCIIKDQKYGKILTCNKVKFSDVRKNDDGKLINQDNEIYPILHQTDRWGTGVVSLLEKIVMQQ